MATTQCPHCRLVLTIPPEGLGRRLKCPSCMGKFHAGTAESRPPSQAPGMMEAGPASASWPSPREKDDIPLAAPGSLREAFDLPTWGSGDARGDVAALFEDDAPPRDRRRAEGASGRAQPRICADCGSMVPAGLSLCGRCGLDQDTGLRAEAGEEDLLPEDDIVYAPTRTAPPGLQVVGIAGLLAAGAVAVMAVVTMVGGGGLALLGAGFLGMLALFLAFASAQMLQARSHRPMLAALALAAVVNVAGLIILPVVNAGTIPAAPQNHNEFLKGIGSDPAAEPNPIAIDPAPGADEDILPSYDVDTKSLAMGLVILMIEGVVFTYLMSAPVREYFETP
ncbi:MAG: hypothetical protein U0800_23855 [Isosphaeraceae bacterium]